MEGERNIALSMEVIYLTFSYIVRLDFFSAYRVIHVDSNCLNFPVGNVLYNSVLINSGIDVVIGLLYKSMYSSWYEDS